MTFIDSEMKTGLMQSPPDSSLTPRSICVWYFGSRLELLSAMLYATVAVALGAHNLGRLSHPFIKWASN